MGTIFDREHEPPEETPADAAYGIVKGLVGVVPGAVEILERVFAPPIARRQREWARDVAESLRQLESRGVRLDDLRDNPTFIDAVLRATDAAIRTSQQEKRQALLNAALNAASPGAPDAALQQMFIALIDRFTEWHLRILKLFAAPAEWRNSENQGLRDTNSLASLIEQAYPQLRGRRELYDLIWSDLHTAGFHRTGSLQTMMTSAMAKRTTELGDAFLAFISSSAATGEK